MLDSVLLTCHHPDVEVCGYSFPMWSRLSSELTAATHTADMQASFTPASGRLASGEPANAPSAAVSARVAPFVPYYQSLVDCIVRSLAYPADSLGWHEDQRDEHKRYRYFASDTLVDALAVLGVQSTLQRLWQHTQPALARYTASSGSEWQLLEAALHAFRAVGGRVPNSEQSVVPALLSLVSAPQPGLVSAQSPHLLAYTCVLLIGRYADWVNHNLSLLPRLLTCIVSALNWYAAPHRCHTHARRCTHLVALHAAHLLSCAASVYPLSVARTAAG